MLKILLIALLMIAVAIIAFLFYQGRASVNKAPPALNSSGALPTCPDKPNCVSSTAAATDDTHYIQPIDAAVSMESIKAAVDKDGGTNIVIDGNLLTATYKSGLFGFVDDLMLQANADHIDVRSSSRVGYSDLDTNRKRVERLRRMLSR